MHLIYNVFAQLSWHFLKIVALFNTKIKLFVEGRKNTSAILENNLGPNDKNIWIHVASLGEFEQGLPIIEKIKSDHPDYKVVVTFFSPSGYEVKKNSSVADVICYLPIDTNEKASSFIKKVNPRLAIFVKYEIWPNYLKILRDHQVPSILFP